MPDHSVIYSSSIGRVMTWKWLWTAAVYLDLGATGEAHGTAFTRKGAQRQMDAYLRSMGVEP